MYKVMYMEYNGFRYLLIGRKTMYGIYNKKNLNLIIFEILWEHTDAEHVLMQQEIVKLVKREYGLEIDRRSVKNNVEALQEMFVGTPYEISMENGYALIGREFADSELRMLIDSILFSKTISNHQAKTLIEKLKNLSNRYFAPKVQHICNLPELQHTDNKQILYTIDVLNDAISMGKKVQFFYNDYGADLKLHPRREEKYVVNPYQMVANVGKYYLIGNYDKYDDVSHYRLDKITEIEILDENVKDASSISELKNGLNLPKHMAEHIYLFGGESRSIKMAVDKNILTELVDWFGKDFRVMEQTKEQVVICVKCNEEAMKYWALQYGPYVEVLEPVSLRERLKEEISGMSRKYGI